MAMYEVGTVTGAANRAKVTGISTKWSEPALGIQEGSILVIYRNGSADLYAIKSVNNDTQLTLTRNITTAFLVRNMELSRQKLPAHRLLRTN